jgi:hypothetical protein
MNPYGPSISFLFVQYEIVANHFSEDMYQRVAEGSTLLITDLVSLANVHD